jgi:hypothetical protein
MAMQGSVSDESGVRTEVDQSIEDNVDEDDDEEKYRRRKEGTPSLRREFWISQASFTGMNKNITGVT